MEMEAVSDGWREGQAIEQHNPVEGISIGNGREHIKYCGAENIEYTQHFLSLKIPVCQHPHKKWCNDHGDGESGIGTANLVSSGSQLVCHVFTHLSVPCAPYKELHEHHERKLESKHWFHVAISFEV
jgi:hypothetical protein